MSSLATCSPLFSPTLPLSGARVCLCAVLIVAGCAVRVALFPSHFGRWVVGIRIRPIANRILSILFLRFQARFSGLGCGEEGRAAEAFSSCEGAEIFRFPFGRCVCRLLSTEIPWQIECFSYDCVQKFPSSHPHISSERRKYSRLENLNRFQAVSGY